MSWTKEKIYDLLCQSKRSCTLGLFIGSGFSKAVSNGLMPGWKELLQRVSSIMKIDDSVFNQGYPYPTIASEICRLYSLNNEGVSRKDAERIFKYHIASQVNEPVNEKQKERFSILSSLSPNWIVTTNYDFIIESVLSDHTLPINPDDSYIKTGDFIPVYHIHGSIADPDSIVITNEDYTQTLRVADYRHARLPFLIKESTVLMIGYSLNDINVLSAVDYSKNVYTNKPPYYDTPIIQLVYSEKPRLDPYVTDQGIVVLEISDICVFLQGFIERDIEYQNEVKETQKKIQELIACFTDASPKQIALFLDDANFRKNAITKITQLPCEYWYIFSSFVSFINRSLGELWYKAYQPQAFLYYRDILRVVLDLIEYTQYDKVPIPYIDSIVDWFCEIAPRVGDELGQSFDAMRLFEKRSKSIPQAFIIEFEKRPYINSKYTQAAELLKNRLCDNNDG